MPYSTSGKNAMLEELKSLATHVSLHTASPGDTGTNEVAGGSYTREAVTWGTVASGAMANTGAIVFDVPASTTITHLGLWSASSAGTFYGYADITDEAFANAGTYTIAIGDLDADLLA